MLIFELGQLRHRVEPIGLAHSQFQVLPKMTVFAPCLETNMVWVSQDAVNEYTKSERWPAVQIPRAY